MQVLAREIRVRSMYGGLSLAAKLWQSDGAQEPRTRKRVLALHGWLDNANSFDALARQLCQLDSSVQLIALDLPGHGLSEWKADGQYYMTDFVAHVAGFIGGAKRELDIADGQSQQSGTRFTIVGHSNGGGVGSLSAVALGPDVCNGLVAIEGLGPVSTAPEHAASSLREALDANLRMLASDGNVDRDGDGDDSRRQYASIDDIVAARHRATPYLSEQLCALLIERDVERHGAAAWTLRRDPNLRRRSLLRFAEPSVLNLLESMHCKTMVVQGSTTWVDHFVSADARVQRLDALERSGNLHSHIVVDSHHHLHMEEEHAASLAVKINDFIDQLT
jgi:pimeloyl-ACP methyl ester carboxylesterase